MARPNSSRMRRIKTVLARRDGAACFYCAAKFTQLRHDATVDHLIPQSVMPGWALANLVLACRPCNEAKADQLPQVFIPQVFVRRVVPAVPVRAWYAPWLDRLAGLFRVTAPTT